MSDQPVKTLTIGGSDSGGAAGIQADLKTWTALGVYGMSVITAVTAQNSETVEAMQYIGPEMVAAQIDAVLSDYGAHALKTGFLGQAQLIEQIARRLQAHAAGPLVVDPVLVTHKGQSMFPAQVASAYREHLLPLAELVTPNWREAALLAGLDTESAPQVEAVKGLAEALCAAGAKQVLITGVPGPEGKIIDWWFNGHELQPLAQIKIETVNRHGSGDTLSAAICANLALGMEMGNAITNAQVFTRRALAGSAAWRMGRGHGPLSHFVNQEQAP